VKIRGRISTADGVYRSDVFFFAVRFAAVNSIIAATY